MDKAKLYWVNNTAQEIQQKLEKKVLVIGLCRSTEQHGIYLPVGTDGLLVERWVVETLKVSRFAQHVLVVDLGWLGVSPEHSGFKGTLSGEVPLVWQYWFEICRAVASHGVLRLLLCNAHGGQVGLLQQLVFSLHSYFPAFCATMQLGQLGFPHKATRKRDIHGGWIESSLMAFWCSELFHPTAHNAELASQEENMHRTKIQGLTQSWHARERSKNGIIAENEVSSYELGRSLAEFATKELEKAIAQALN